jgi:hypothetical protein
MKHLLLFGPLGSLGSLGIFGRISLPSSPPLFILRGEGFVLGKDDARDWKDKRGYRCEQEPRILLILRGGAAKNCFLRNKAKLENLLSPRPDRKI